MLSAIYIGPNDFCFCRSKSVTPRSGLKPWALWTVDAHANIKRYWLHLIDRDADSFFIGISALHFSIATQEFCLRR